MNEFEGGGKVLGKGKKYMYEGSWARRNMAYFYSGAWN